MATKQRVFSPNNTIHYDDYLKRKQGNDTKKNCEIYLVRRKKRKSEEHIILLLIRTTKLLT